MAKTLPPTTIAAWARLLRAQRLLLDAVEADLKADGLPPLVWYDVLHELAEADSGRLRHRDLSGAMLLAKHNLTRLIDRMAEAGLVERQAVDEDARGAFLALTPKGREMRRAMWPVYRRAIEQHFADRLSEAEIATLAAILGRLLGRG
ncbi:MAG: MarR family winged helix-turn-helix transcriptional regulator [Bauldia sp.]